MKSGKNTFFTALLAFFSFERRTRSLYLLFFSFFVLVFGTSFLGYGEQIIPGKPIHLSIDSEIESQKLEGIQYSIYKIGEIDEHNTLVMDAPFSAYPIDIKNSNSEDWNHYSESLKSFVLGDAVAPLYTGESNSQGEVQFSLQKGVYFILPKDLVTEEVRYTTAAFFLSLPELDFDSGHYLYDVQSFPKIKKEKLPPKPISITVFKLWEDPGAETERPKTIEIDLLADGLLKESAVLKEENNWRIQFPNLDPSKEYTVVEKNVDAEKYTVKLKEDGRNFFFQNTYIPPGRPEKEPKEPPGGMDKESKKETPSSEEEKNREKPGESEGERNLKKEKLPQTGQPWNVVMMFSGTGIVCIMLGSLIEWKKKQ